MSEASTFEDTVATPPRSAYAFPIYACERCWHGESEMTIRTKCLDACPKCGGTMRSVGIPVTDAPSPCNLLCIVCARVKPWGIWDSISGVAVCVGCRDKARSPTSVLTAERRNVVTEFARTAHYLMNDSGFTRAMAATALAQAAVKHNGSAWDESALTTLLGDAAKLIGRSNA